MEFFEKPERTSLILSLTAGGALQASFDWPSQLKTKACYFAKKNRDPINKDANIRQVLLFGDISPNPVDQLAVFVEDVCNLLLYIYIYIIQISINLSIIQKFFRFSFQSSRTKRTTMAGRMSCTKTSCAMCRTFATLFSSLLARSKVSLGPRSSFTYTVRIRLRYFLSPYYSSSLTCRQDDASGPCRERAPRRGAEDDRRHCRSRVANSGRLHVQVSHCLKRSFLCLSLMRSLLVQFNGFS